MKLNHLDLQVPDVQALAAFLVTHFGLGRQSNDRSPALAILTDDGGLVLVLQRGPARDGGHIGFYVDTVAAVEAHHARLTAAEVPVGPVERSGRGTLFYVRAHQQLIEVNCRQ